MLPSGSSPYASVIRTLTLLYLPGWSGPYTSDGKLPKDNWGEPYQYAFPGTRNKDSYDIWSKGPDKQSGTADDIGNWEIASPAEK